MKPRVEVITALDGKKRLAVGWIHCLGCGCLVRPKKYWCCTKCKKTPGQHSPVRHYKPKDISETDVLKGKGEDKQLVLSLIPA